MPNVMNFFIIRLTLGPLYPWQAFTFFNHYKVKLVNKFVRGSQETNKKFVKRSKEVSEKFEMFLKDCQKFVRGLEETNKIFTRNY